MSELVDDFGPEAFRHACRLAGKARTPETRQGNDRGAAVQLRLAEDEGQDRDEEVRIGQSHDAHGVPRPSRGEPQKDAVGRMLKAGAVERVDRPFGRHVETRWDAEHPLDVRAHALEESGLFESASDPPKGDLSHGAPAAAGAAVEGGPSAASGSRIVIVVPSPAGLATRIEPPCFSTIP